MDKPILYSTGYSGDKTIEQARTNVRPKPGKIADAARDASARYLHVGELGNRNHRNGGGILLDRPAEGVRRVLDAVVRTGKSPLLLCACADVTQCHRLVVGKRFEGHASDWLEILDWTNPAECGSRFATVYSESMAFEHWPAFRAELEAMA